MYCQQHESQLTSIHSEEDRKDAAAMCSTKSPHIGSDGCWRGLHHDQDSDSWQWTDGTSTEYVNTGALPSADECMHLFVDQHFAWNEAPCADLNYPLCRGLNAHDAHTYTPICSLTLRRSTASDADLQQGR